jgi:hypothetical protein
MTCVTNSIRDLPSELDRIMVGRIMARKATARADTQLVELAGRSWLISQLLQAKIEVARPERDRGVDLIAYLDLDESVGDFIACPIQVKVASTSMFSVDPKYEKFHRMLLVYVWNVKDSTRTVAYVLTYQEALGVADRMGWTKTASWKTGGRHQRRGYAVTSVAENSRLWNELQKFLITPQRLKDKLIEIGRQPR